MKLSELAAYLKAELILPEASGLTADFVLTTLEPIATAKAGALTFLTHDDYASFLATTQASAIILAKPLSGGSKMAQLVHKNPYWAFAKAAQVFFPPKKEQPGIAPQAYVAPTAVVPASATIYPQAFVSEGARLGERVVLYPGVYIGPCATIGDDTVLKASVIIEAGVKVGARVLIHAGAVLGADGFGFAPGEGGYAKIPQVGTVVIGDEVEIGALTTVDRGALEDTVVGRGTKLDDHVHLGHGSGIGEHSIMCAYAGLAGSAKMGNWVVIGGHTGVNNRVEIADRVQIGSMSGVTKDLKEPGVYMGFPARPAGEWRREIVRLRHLADMEKTLTALTKQVEELKARLPPAL